MDALFSWRKTRAKDLAECLQLHPAKNGAELIGRARALRAWRQLFEMSHATRSAVVELHRNNRVDIVGFGFASFVKKHFAEDEVQNPRPGLNARIIESVANGKSVVATYADVRDANTRGDLQQVILDTSWKDGPLTVTQVDEVRVLLGQAYYELFVGYHFSRILSEMVDERDLWHVRGHRSLRDVSIAKALFVTLPAIKRRWSNIFERVGSIKPELCPMDGEGTRGTQKRQRILTYVRSHPEELRPFDFSDGAKRQAFGPSPARGGRS
jgi:hypothetical protein